MVHISRSALLLRIEKHLSQQNVLRRALKCRRVDSVMAQHFIVRITAKSLFRRALESRRVYSVLAQRFIV
jgi:hypothetical protein